MSARARGTFALCVSLTILGLSQTCPAGGQASQPADNVGSYGAVQEALQLLYVMPHPSARQRESLPDGSTPARPAQSRESNRALIQATPRQALSASDRAALEHAQLLPRSDESDDQEATASTQPAAWAAAPYGYGPRVSRLPQHRRDFANYRYFGGRPGTYGFGGGYAGDDFVGDWYRDAFLQQYDHERFVAESEARTDAVLMHFKGHLSRGLTLFNQGRYSEAADAFRMSANANQGDPASRLYTAHALFATGRYQEAIPYLRRAYELQPQITYLNFDMRDDYGNKADFDRHLKELEEAIRLSPSNLDRLIMLGYVKYYTKQRTRAFEVLTTANQIDKRDPLVLRLLDNSRPPDVVLDRMNGKK